MFPCPRVARTLCAQALLGDVCGLAQHERLDVRAGIGSSTTVPVTGRWDTGGSVLVVECCTAAVNPGRYALSAYEAEIVLTGQLVYSLRSPLLLVVLSHLASS